MNKEMNNDHGYNVLTMIDLHLSIGISNASQKDRMKLGELIGMDQEELDGASKLAIDQMVHEALVEWSNNYIDMGWSAEGSE